MNVALFVIAGWVTFATLTAVGGIGKPGRPLTAGTAVVLIVINAAEVALVITAGMRLH